MRLSGKSILTNSVRLSTVPFTIANTAYQQASNTSIKGIDYRNGIFYKLADGSIYTSTQGINDGDFSLLNTSPGGQDITMAASDTFLYIGGRPGSGQPTRTAYRHDLTTGARLATLTFSSLPNDWIRGIASDGTNLFITVPNRIYKMVGDTDVIDYDFSTPENFPRGLCFNGSGNLMFHSDFDKIWELNPVTGAVITTGYTSPGTAGGDLAFDGSNLISLSSGLTPPRLYAHPGIGPYTGTL